MSANFWVNLKRPIIALAPMAGVTDDAFRELCKSLGADVVYTEFASVDGLVYESKKTLELIRFSNAQRPLVAQIFGRNPEYFHKAAKMVESLGVDGIDINFGCPSKKVVCSGGGVNLMRNLDRAYEVIQATCESVRIPVSVKMRAGIKKQVGGVIEKFTNEQGDALLEPTEGCTIYPDRVTAIDFVKRIRTLPISAMMIHGRTYEQGFSGEPDYETIRQIVELVDIPVLANGGINTPEAAVRILQKTGAAGVGVARGAQGQPWVFTQIKELLTNGSYSTPGYEEVREIAIRHARMAFASKDERGILEMRKHLGWYFTGFPGASELRKQLVQVTSLEDIERILSNFSPSLLSISEPALV